MIRSNRLEQICVLERLSSMRYLCIFLFSFLGVVFHILLLNKQKVGFLILRFHFSQDKRIYSSTVWEGFNREDYCNNESCGEWGHFFLDKWDDPLKIKLTSNEWHLTSLYCVVLAGFRWSVLSNAKITPNLVTWTY